MRVYTGDSVAFAARLVNKLFKVWNLWSEFLNLSSQAVGNVLRVGGWREFDGGSDAHFYFKWASSPPAGTLHFEQTVNPHGDDGDVQVIHQQAHASAKRAHLAVGGVMAFGENQNTESAIDRLAAKSEAFAEARVAG